MKQRQKKSINGQQKIGEKTIGNKPVDKISNSDSELAFGISRKSESDKVSSLTEPNFPIYKQMVEVEISHSD